MCTHMHMHVQSTRAPSHAMLVRACQVAHEHGVRREADGGVAEVEEQHAVVQLEAGDFLLMKGGLWPGAEGRGAAHRAPAIGPVPSCTTHRLLLKVDCSEDF